MTENQKKKEEHRPEVYPKTMSRRRSSVHLEQAEDQLEERAINILGPSKDYLLDNGLNCEYYRLLNSVGGHKPRYAGVSIQGDKLVTRYGTKEREITREFYNGEQTAYFMDTLSIKSKLYGGLPVRNSSIKTKIYETQATVKPGYVKEVRKYLRGDPTPRTDSEDLSKLPPLQKSKKSNLDKSLGKVGFKKSILSVTDDSEFLLSRENERQMMKHHGAPRSRPNNFGPMMLPAIQTTSDVSSGDHVDIRHGASLTVSGARQTESFDQQRRQSKFDMRKDYGKNLERNWYMSFLQKARDKNWRHEVDLRLEMFYSPELYESEGESNDRKSLPDSARSHAVAQDIDADQEATQKVDSLAEATELPPEMFSSTDVLMGEKGELDRATPEDIEIILHENKLVERVTKHKMHKKRRRKEEQYKKLILNGKLTEHRTTDPRQLTDKELRARRLNLKKKTTYPKLNGKRRFRQVVNTIITAIYFSKMLKSIREKNRKERRERMKRLKKVTWRQKSKCTMQEEESQPDTPTMKEKFMTEIGEMLVKDVQRISLISNSVSEERSEKEKTEQQSSNKETSLRRSSRFESVVNLCSTEDVHKSKFTGFGRRLRSKSYSDVQTPGPFFIEVRGKNKRRKRDHSKSVARRSRSSKRPDARFSVFASSPPACTCKPRREQPMQPSSRSQSQAHSHQAQPEEKVAKIKTVAFQRKDALRRRMSLDESDFINKKELSLEELLDGINIPAKEIRIQIVRRKMKKKLTRYRRMSIEKSPAIPPQIEKESPQEKQESDSETESESSSSDDEPNIYQRSPYVSACVSWNATAMRPRKPTWTVEDVEREVRRVTRLFLDMKDCGYIRWTSFHQAVIGRVNSIND